MGAQRGIPTSTVVAATALVIAGILAHRVGVARPYSRPEATIEAFFAGLAAADLSRVERASLRDFFTDFVSHFGATRRARVQEIYDYVYRLGLGVWRRYRNQADATAAYYYGDLHERVNALGRQAFARLSVDERMALIEDQAQYERFIVSEGVNALPPEDRKRIGDVDAFREGRDRASFVERESFSLLPAADREFLGSPRALSREETPEKLAFLDRVGLKLLSDELRREIEGIPRSDLADPAAFDLKYGKPLAVAFLQRTKLPTPSLVACRYPSADVRGSLFRGRTSSCSVSVQSSQMDAPATIVVTLEKTGFSWLVQAVEPRLYDTGW